MIVAGKMVSAKYPTLHRRRISLLLTDLELDCLDLLKLTPGGYALTPRKHRIAVLSLADCKAIIHWLAGIWPVCNACASVCNLNSGPLGKYWTSSLRKYAEGSGCASGGNNLK